MSDPSQPPMHRRRGRTRRIPLVPQGPQDLGSRPPRRLISIPRLLRRAGRLFTRREGWLALLATGVGVAAVAGCWYAATYVYQDFGTRTISVCVATDLAYRAEKPDWWANLQPLFATINRMFQGTGVKWAAWDGGEAYPPGAPADLLSRGTWLSEHPPCRADVVLALTAQPDPQATSLAEPFSHTLLVEDTAANTPAISAMLIARSLAKLFGVPGSTQALILADATGAIFDASAVRIIRGMRRYDFAKGIEALSGRTEASAVSTLTDALAGKDPHPEAQARLIVGRAFAAGMRFDDAAREMGEAARLEGRNSGLYFEYAMALQAAARDDEAIAELKTAAKLDPADGRPYAAMGVINLNRRRVDDAVDEFRMAVQLDPHNASYQAALGTALSSQPGQIEEASAAFEQAMKLKPNEPGAYAGLAREDGVEQRLLEAVRAMEAEVGRQSSSSLAHLKLGLAQAYAGNRDAARKELERAIALDPANGNAHLALARLDYLTGQYGAAKTELDAARANGGRPLATFVAAVERKASGR